MDNKKKWTATIFIPGMKIFFVEVEKWSMPYTDIPMIKIEATDGAIYFVPPQYMMLMKGTED